MRDFSRLTEQAQVVASERGLREALALGHNYIGSEHLLLAAARDYLPDKDARIVQNLVMKQMGDRCPTCGQLKPEARRNP